MNDSHTADLPLVVEQPDDPAGLAAHPEALRQAFKASGVWRHGITFEQALATPALRICLTTAAQIKARKFLEQRT